MERYEIGWHCQSLDEDPDGDMVYYKDIEPLIAENKSLREQLAALQQDRDEWKGCFDGQLEVYKDIANILEAKIPEQLVTSVALQRMETIQRVRDLCSVGCCECDKIAEVVK